MVKAQEAQIHKCPDVTEAIFLFRTKIKSSSWARNFLEAELSFCNSSAQLHKQMKFKMLFCVQNWEAA